MRKTRIAMGPHQAAHSRRRDGSCARGPPQASSLEMRETRALRRPAMPGPPEVATRTEVGVLDTRPPPIPVAWRMVMPLEGVRCVYSTRSCYSRGERAPRCCGDAGGRHRCAGGGQYRYCRYCRHGRYCRDRGSTCALSRLFGGGGPAVPRSRDGAALPAVPRSHSPGASMRPMEPRPLPPGRSWARQRGCLLRSVARQLRLGPPLGGSRPALRDPRHGPWPHGQPAPRAAAPRHLPRLACRAPGGGGGVALG